MRFRTRSLLAAVLVALAHAHPVPAQDAGLEAVAWMGGCWVAESSDALTEEMWMLPSGGLMVGMARTVRDGRARGHEFLLLSVKEGLLTYSAHPSGQAAADFGAVDVEEGRVRFENPNHDSPKALEYRRLSTDSIIVGVFGEIDASGPDFQVRYERAVCSEPGPTPRRRPL